MPHQLNPVFWIQGIYRIYLISLKALLIHFVNSLKQNSEFFNMSTGVFSAVASEGNFFTTFFTVFSETDWKENFLFILTLKTHLRKNQCHKNAFLFSFLKLSELEFFFSEVRFLYLGESKKQTWQPLIMQTGKEIKKKTGLKREETDWNWEILHKSIYAYLHKRKLLSPRAKVLFFFVFFFFRWNFTFFVYTFFFRHRNETKAMNFTKHRRETSLLHTLSHKCLRSFNFIILL